jgi:ferredoxin-NADP reductase
MEYVVKILKIDQVTHDVKRFLVEKPDGYMFTPGQATDVSINQSSWKEEKRPFTFTSLQSDPYLEFTIKIYLTKHYPDHGGFTEKLDTLSEGDTLIIRDPWGAITYDGKGVFIAGGAGITPFIAILRDLHARHELQGNMLIFSNKTAKDVILEQELKSLLGDDALLVLTQEDECANKYICGVIDKTFLQEHIADYEQKFYVCGPEQMVKDIREALHNLGAATNEIIFEN